MMNYTPTEADVITADSLRGLNLREKKLLLAAHSSRNADGGKYADLLIKTVGEGVYNNMSGDFLSPEYRKGVFDGLEKARLGCVTVKSDDYPHSLKQISDPPLVLYYRGNRQLLGERKVCVVGSRRTTAQMSEECRRLCSRLSEHVAVVTGVADGADRSAAVGAMEGMGAICVLPCGHSAVNVTGDFLKKVEGKGLTVSEYPPDVRTQRHTFVQRNRILAALAEATVVISADIDGGALSTASFAADYSRDVFAYPYSIGVPSGRGCNALIKSGAFMCEGAEDVFSVLGIKCGEAAAVQSADGFEGEVLAALKERGETHAQQLATGLGKPLTEVITALSMLEIKGLAVRTGGNAFAAIK